MSESSLHYIVARENYYRNDQNIVVGRGNQIIVGIYHHWLYGIRCVNHAARLVKAVRANIDWNTGKSWGPDVHEMFSGNTADAPPAERYRDLLQFGFGFDENGNYKKLHVLEPQSNPFRNGPCNGFTVTDIRDMHNIKHCFGMQPPSNARGAAREWQVYDARGYMKLTYSDAPDAYWRRVRIDNPTKEQKRQRALYIAGTVRGMNIASRRFAALNTQPFTVADLHELWPDAIPAARARRRSTTTAAA